VALSDAKRHFVVEQRRTQIPGQMSLFLLKCIHLLGLSTKEKWLYFHIVRLEFIPFFVNPLLEQPKFSWQITWSK
jgi:hypothetical protein